MNFQDELIGIKQEILALKQGNKVASTIKCYQFQKLLVFTLPPRGSAATYRIQIKYKPSKQPTISTVSDVSEYNLTSGGSFTSTTASMMKSPVQNNAQYAWLTVWNTAGDDPAPNRVYVIVNSTAEVEDIIIALE